MLQHKKERQKTSSDTKESQLKAKSTHRKAYNQCSSLYHRSVDGAYMLQEQYHINVTTMSGSIAALHQPEEGP